MTVPATRDSSTETAAAPAILVVEDDDLVSAWLVRAFAKWRPVVRVGNVQDAQRRLCDKTARYVALVTDVGLPDGSGLDVVRIAREQRESIAVLVLTGSSQPKVVNGSFLLGASFLRKPTTSESLEMFARRAIACEAVEDTRVLRALEGACSEWGLSDREAELLGISIADKARDELAAALGVTENTAKTYVKGLLRKSGARSVDHLVQLILRRALSGAAS